MAKIFLQNGWSAGEDSNGNREYSISLHFQDAYNGQRSFLPADYNNVLRVGVENDNPSGLPAWQDLILISDLLNNNDLYKGHIDPAYGLIYIKYDDSSNPSLPDNLFVIMSNPMSVGVITQERSDTLDDKKSGRTKQITRIVILTLLGVLYLLFLLWFVVRWQLYNVRPNLHFVLGGTFIVALFSVMILFITRT